MSPMMKEQAKKVSVALLLGVLSALATGYLLSHRDLIFAWEWASPHGKFEAAPHAGLQVAARDFAEAKRPGAVCVEKWLGRDDRFVYLALGCARFQETLGEVRAHGDATFQPVRFGYEGEQVTSMEGLTPGAWDNSLRRMFPKEAADKFRLTVSQPEFEKRGLARMAERGLSTLGD